MGYKLKRILIYPDGVTEKQVYPALPIPSSGLLGYRPLHENANDMSGNGYNGTLYGSPTFGTYQGKQSVRLDTNGINNGSTNYIITSLNYSNTSVSALVWFYCTNGLSTPDSWQLIMGNEGTDANTCVRIRVTKDSGERVPLQCYGTYYSSTGTITGSWKFIAITSDGTNVNFYVNGTKVDTQTISVSPANNTYWHFGHGYYTGSYRRPFNGYIRDAAVYNRALTDSEVLKYYQQTS